jgi:hypothetical protein
LAGRFYFISIGLLVILTLILCWTVIFGGSFAFYLLAQNEVAAKTLPPEMSDSELLNQTVKSDASYDIPPTISIDEPVPGSIIPRNTVVVNGSASDADGNLEKVEIFINKYPFGGTDASFNGSIGSASDNEHKNIDWSFPVDFDSSGVYRILAHAEDNSKNNKWAEMIIYIPFNSYDFSSPQMLNSQVAQRDINNDASSVDNTTKIAIVNPTFTDAAYGPNAFYTFYAKHDRSGIYDKILPSESNVTTDLDMLTTNLDSPVWIEHSTPADLAKNMSMFSSVDPDNRQIGLLKNHIENELLPNRSQVTVIRDQDVHNGYIFGEDNGFNAYDILILNHDEYASQQMYDNYKKFVENGGTMILLDGNTFYAEVKYDPLKNTITLVKGHDWEFEFDKVARQGPHERWFDENRAWIGSNFLLSDIKDNITFANNPFNYTHFEDNFVNNPNVTVILDYDARIPAANPFSGAKIATYEMPIGKGKVIVIGIYGENLIKENNKEFLKFLDYLLLKSAINS